MFHRSPARKLIQLDDRGPLRVMFMITSMPVGGAEMLLVQLVRRMDREHFVPEICCLKDKGPLGEMLSEEMTVHSNMLSGKFDYRVLRRLRGLMGHRRIDAVITVGAGDKMFWGRLAAWLERVPVIASALHSTGWPDGIGFLNRRLTPITDAFIGVAAAHGKHLVERERFPAGKVHVIPNGIDTDAFAPPQLPKDTLRRQLHLPVACPTACIVAALRPEKNHAVLLQAAARVRNHVADAQFLIVGDGPERSRLEQLSADLNLTDAIHFLGTRHDIPRILQASDVFVLTSDNEAAPVSILEAMSTSLPVVATKVGSVPEIVRPGVMGLLAEPRDVNVLATHLTSLLTDSHMAECMGQAGRAHVLAHGSLGGMVRGYERLVQSTYQSKARQSVSAGGLPEQVYQHGAQSQREPQTCDPPAAEAPAADPPGRTSE